MVSVEATENARTTAKLIDLDGHLPRPFMGIIEKVLGFRTINKAYADLASLPTREQFIEAVLERIRVSFAVREDELAAIPESGPLIIVANHPFGAVEGLILALVLMRRRPDAKIIANYLLGRVERLRDMLILVNPFQTEKSADQNRAPMRRALSHLAAGGAVAMFPAGEVAHMTWTSGVRECPWTRHLARLVRFGKCPVVPVYFDGFNSTLFQLAGLCHPRLRTVLLAREMVKMEGQRVDVRIGGPIPFARLARLDNDSEIVEHLRSRTLALGFRRTVTAPARPVKRKLEPIIDPLPQQRLIREVAMLRPDQALVQSNELTAYLAESWEIPNLLREIGRLREITFRETGEGTGRCLDLDRFDDYYQHLFVWDSGAQQVVGGYRIGFSHRIIRKYGVGGLYTNSLFKLHPDLFRKLGPSLELGRSFVRCEYQKSYAPLLLLWKGVSRMMYLNPGQINLLGPVSISANYDTNTRRLMVDFLNCHHRDGELGELVRARNPFRQNARAMLGRLPRHADSDPDAMSELIEELEGDGKGMPVLLRQYLKLGAKVLAFNVDPDFSDVLDALLVVNMLKADARSMQRYMGAKEYREYLNFPRQAMTAMPAIP